MLRSWGMISIGIDRLLNTRLIPKSQHYFILQETIPVGAREAEHETGRPSALQSDSGEF